MKYLEIKDLKVSIEGEKILRGVSLTVDKGEIVTLMGPNGSGKSTLAYALMGHPKYKITGGKIIFMGKDITNLAPHKRAQLGLFLGFQHPQEISGVTVANFLRTAINSIRGKGKEMPIPEFLKSLKENMKLLTMDTSFSSRYLNQGFSGGEKKKAEILQLAMLNPKVAVLDETDSGTDVDTLKVLGKSVNNISKTKQTGILLITHYNRILQYMKPDTVHIMLEGKIVDSGKAALAEQIEKEGYGKYHEAVAE